MSVCVCTLSYPACNAHAPYCLLSPAPLYNVYPRYLINGEIFEKRLLNIKFVFWFSLQLLSATFPILRRTGRDILKNVYRSSSKVPLILVRFKLILNFLDIFSKNTQVSNFMKIRPVGAELFHADEGMGRRTDRQTNLIVAFCNFANTPKKSALM